MLTLLWACTTAQNDKSADRPADAVDVTVSLPAEVPEETGDTGETGDTAPVDTGPYEDVDHDGYEAASTGGDDCDDENEWVHPGAPEYCDSIDQDCDGEPLAAGSCAMEQVIEAMSEVVLDDPESVVISAIAAGDLTQDGVADVRVMDRHEGRWSQYIYAGGPDLADRMMSRSWWAILDDGTNPYDIAVSRFGDVNGDGYEDIGLIDSWYAEATIWYGPFPEGTVGGGAGKETWSYPGEGLEWAGYPEITGEDVDGDGKSDFIVKNLSGSMVDDRAFAYAIGFGGAPGDTCLVHQASLIDEYASSARLLGDGDGDGVDELMMGDRVILGSDVRLLCSADIDDVAVGDLSAGGEAVGLTDFDVATTLRDRSGDGSDEVVVYGEDDAGSSTLRFYETADLATESPDFDAFIGSYSSESGAFVVNGSVRIYDGAEGGVPELYGELGDGISISHIEHLPSGVEAWPTATVSFSRHSTADVFGEPAEGASWNICEYEGCSDVTGDGLLDLFFQTTSYDGDYHTMIRLLEGSPIPWDEPTYW